jgi:aldehyde dehydrogenase (NAD+)
MRQFNQMYVNGAFVTPRGKATVDLVNPTNNEVIGKVTLADEVDARQAIAAAKKALASFSQTAKEVRMDYLQRLHDSVSKRVGDLVQATVLEYGAPQDRAKGSNALAANIFLHFKDTLKKLLKFCWSPSAWSASSRPGTPVRAQLQLRWRPLSQRDVPS